MADSLTNLSDSALLTTLDTLRNTLTANAADYPAITAPMKSELDTLRDDFNDKLNFHMQAQADAKAKTADKNAKRGEVEEAIRKIRNINKANSVDDAKMIALGVPMGSTPAPANATVPAGAVNTSERLRHTITWTDAAATDNKKKPRGAMGVEIWVKVDGPPPGSEKDCVFLTLDAFTPYVAEFDAADAGKTAHYMLRWRMRDGSTGAWGETVSATITG